LCANCIQQYEQEPSPRRQSGSRERGARILANVESYLSHYGGMEKCFQPLELNGLRPGDRQVSRQVAMIEEPNRLERELRETLVQEFAGILPQLEPRLELQNRVG